MNTRFLEPTPAALPADWKACLAELRRHQVDAVLRGIDPTRLRLAELRQHQLDAVLHALEPERPPSTASPPPAARADDAPRRQTTTRTTRWNHGGSTLHPVENPIAKELDPTAVWQRWQQPLIALQIRACPPAAVGEDAQPELGLRSPTLTRRALKAQLAARDRQLAECEQHIAHLTLAVARERETHQRDVRLLELMLNALREELSYLRGQNTRPSGPSPLPPALLKRLRSLCHPDRWHGLPQEQTALEVMQWLNGLPSRP